MSRRNRQLVFGWTCGFEFLLAWAADDRAGVDAAELGRDVAHRLRELSFVPGIEDFPVLLEALREAWVEGEEASNGHEIGT